MTWCFSVLYLGAGHILRPEEKHGSAARGTWHRDHLWMGPFEQRASEPFVYGCDDFRLWLGRPVSLLSS